MEKNRLLDELQRIAVASGKGDLSAMPDLSELSAEEQMAGVLLVQILSNYKTVAECEIAKSQLADSALSLAKWGIEVTEERHNTDKNVRTSSESEMKKSIRIFSDADLEKIFTSDANDLADDGKGSFADVLAGRMVEAKDGRPYYLSCRVMSKDGVERKLHMFGVAI